MSDPVKVALDAAGEAVRAALVKPGCCMEGTGCELLPCHCSSVAAVAAIATFLLALPACWPVSGDPRWYLPEHLAADAILAATGLTLPSQDGEPPPHG